MPALKAILQWSTIILLVPIFGFLAIVIGYLDPSKKGAAIVARYFYRTILFVTGIKVKVQHVERIQKKTTYLVCSNHQGLFDIISLGASLPLYLSFVSKPSYFQIPIVGWGMKAAGHLKVTRTNSEKDRKTMEQLVQLLKKGRTFVMFPEGTRTRDGTIGPFKMGAFHAATEANCPILPITISGSRERLPKGTRTPVPGDIILKIGKPILVEGMEAHQLRGKVREAITQEKA